MQELRPLHRPDVYTLGSWTLELQILLISPRRVPLSGDGPLLWPISTLPWQRSKSDSSNAGKLFRISSKVCCVCRCAAFLEPDTLRGLLPRWRSDDAGVSGLKCNHGFTLVIFPSAVNRHIIEIKAGINTGVWIGFTALQIRASRGEPCCLHSASGNTRDVVFGLRVTDFHVWL